MFTVNTVQNPVYVDLPGQITSNIEVCDDFIDLRQSSQDCSDVHIEINNFDTVDASLNVIEENVNGDTNKFLIKMALRNHSMTQRR